MSSLPKNAKRAEEDGAVSQSKRREIEDDYDTCIDALSDDSNRDEDLSLAPLGIHVSDEKSNQVNGDEGGHGDDGGQR